MNESVLPISLLFPCRRQDIGASEAIGVARGIAKPGDRHFVDGVGEAAAGSTKARRPQG
jgi:hypothetical protein